ncbi:hypothetical protein FOCG_10948 [Fusarium oxysporum f. sp. radicis-lycopersici 26381]|uniref:Uncharacterized protein n=3 Tax=Fusarium oxysporum TaxID=5507 RepID=A0A2H3H308_FUSOX|nr:hypothetical protein FOZG_12721 [Fusarium oxysporum Fo47]EWZ94992.1 hypothetical protein FOWG_05066 [Fusarium oxysporum f. sp. lycopersici MN25]EXL48630.1 hypothetical protein FOCG_10948 [Fusarium oxysporum f. sp. radicis-lycopersici 26381]PCD30902.1 hypothetical protein AU210_010571 [Fusarium oxysporum f. sp. radicis-cucumerinum]RKK14640.1 hypothetical protein BFJ65_g11194 [Fusarium oxysporum f. sp. cepae]RKK97955.1 hypothetical protein BFJ71_g7013 [Fusarium oxysporum]
MLLAVRGIERIWHERVMRFYLTATSEFRGWGDHMRQAIRFKTSVFDDLASDTQVIRLAMPPSPLFFVYQSDKTKSYTE